MFPMETSAVTNDNITVLKVKLGGQTCLAPCSIRKRSMPHVGNTRRVRKPWPHIFYNTIGHPFPHSINVVPQFDFSSLINRVFPEPTFVQCSPVRLVIFSSSHVILNMCFAIAKVFVTVGRYTWRLPTVSTHFELVPSCISYCGDKVK